MDVNDCAPGDPRSYPDIKDYFTNNMAYTKKPGQSPGFSLFSELYSFSGWDFGCVLRRVHLHVRVLRLPLHIR